MEDTLNTLICTRIPLAQHIGMKIIIRDDKVAIHAPLEANRNHMGTGFAGSLSAICMLCGWAQVLNLIGPKFDGDVVLKDAQLRYLRPVESDIVANIRTPRSGHINTFMQNYAQTRKANLQLQVDINAGDKRAVAFRGTYTAYDI